jgi:hypothetical protein
MRLVRSVRAVGSAEMFSRVAPLFSIQRLKHELFPSVSSAHLARGLGIGGCGLALSYDRGCSWMMWVGLGVRGLGFVDRN